MNIGQWLSIHRVWILPPLLGAIIGYFTNWLAIRMLFRPYRKWRLGPIPIPFTPGLLPTRREEIAEKVGLVISEQLINQTELTRTLGEAHLQSELARIMAQYWDKIQKEEWTLAEIIKRLLGEQALRSLQTNTHRVIPSVLHAVEQTGIKQKTIREISKKIEKVLQKTPEEEILNLWGIKGAQLIQQKIASLANEDVLKRFESQYENKLTMWQESNASAYDVLGEEYIIPVTHFIHENPEVVATILERLLSNEDFLDRLVPFIQRIFDKHWSLSFLSALLSSERLRIMIYSLAEDGRKWLASDENQIQLSTQIAQWVEEIFKKPLSDLGFNSTGTFRSEQMIVLIEKGLTLLTSEDATRVVDKLRMTISKKVTQKSYAEWLSIWDVSPRAEDLEKFLSIQLQHWLEQPNRIEELSASVSMMINTIMDCSFAPAMGTWQPREEYWLNVAGEIQNTLAKTIPHGLRLVDVSKMVERKLNEFPLQELEKLTLTIAGRELKAITWVGGFLGFMIGSLQLLLR